MRLVRGTVTAVVLAVLAAPIGLAQQENTTAVKTTTLQPATSGDVDTYRKVVQEYRRTLDSGSSLKPLMGWRADQIDQGIKALIGRADTPELEAAATLHLEIGIAVVGLAPGSAAAYFEQASTMMAATLPPLQIRKGLSAERQAEIAEMNATVLRVAASAFLSAYDVQIARQFSARARRLTPKSAPVMTVSAAVEELDAGAIDPNVWDTAAQRQRAVRDRARLLLRAEMLYRAALEADPGYALARIGLGHVQHLQSNRRDARISLEAGRAAAVESRHKFLAAMFIGALHQDERDLDGARRSFEEARAIVPQSQNAVSALAYVEMMAGHLERAQDLAREFSSATQPDTWWAYKSGLLDLEGLRWLRARIRP